MLKVSEHANIDNLISSTDNQNREALKSEAMDKLEEVLAWRSINMDANMTKREIELLIELIVRIEAFEQKKGFWFRFKRRGQLIMRYT
jgi:hypothetical protein